MITKPIARAKKTAIKYIIDLLKPAGSKEDWAWSTTLVSETVDERDNAVSSLFCKRKV